MPGGCGFTAMHCRRFFPWSCWCPKSGSRPRLSGSAKPATSDKDNVAKKLGINETKTADPKKNPLDNAGDDLFKDIK